MAHIDFDLDRFARQARAKAETLESARQRKMIDVYIEHTTSEIAGELDRVMATMVPEPNFHIWLDGRDIGPKGGKAVKAMYKNMFATRSNFMDMDFHRVVIDDTCFIKEYTQRKIMPGVNFTSGPLGDALRALGQEPDPSAYYLTKGRAIVLLPFDDQCRMLGEDAYTAGQSAIRKLSEDEMPENYQAWLNSAAMQKHLASS